MESTISNNIKIAVISNIIFDPFFIPLIKSQFETSLCKIEIISIPYEEIFDYEQKERIKESSQIIVWLNLESLSLNNNQSEEDVVNVCKLLYVELSVLNNSSILWFLFDDYNSLSHITQGQVYGGFTDTINNQIYEALHQNEGITFIDLKALIAKVGIANAYDNKGKYRWNAPYSKALIQAAVNEIHKQYLIDKGVTKKCLVLDCDGVLWGGVISEDGIENIKLGGSGFGRPYQDFQRFLLDLYSHGVILAICSKNDLSDVMTVFNEHSEMVLKESHIACFKVNWENKPDNIKHIAETLNISLDSMVFVDDSPVEIEAVKSLLHEVTAILYDRDSVYNSLSCFNLKSKVNLSDITKRNDTYRTNQSREALKAKYENYEEYIAALDIKMDIHEALPIEYSRIAELTQRTNKCTNGKRYTVTEIKERVSCDNVKLYSLSVSDRFSDLGIVGAVEIDGDTLMLFCLSCRALGREIEIELLEFIASKYSIHNIEFKSTGKNNELKQFLAKAFKKGP